jgi:hypothetical protein
MVGVIDPAQGEARVATAPRADGVVAKLVRLARLVAGFAYELLTNV